MIFDDDTSRRPHLSLPLETVEELAAKMTSQPSPAEVEAITAAVRHRAGGQDHLAVSPSRVKADLGHAGTDVTVEQVAWVMSTMRPFAGVTERQHIATNDGTEITVLSWLANPSSAMMAPGKSEFVATCPAHGELETSYVSMTVMFAVLDHADEHHGGVRSTGDVLNVGPSIQM